MKKHLIVATLVVLALPLLGATGSRVGEPAPPFTATDLQGNEISLASLKGNVVVIHFATTW